jgi:hypothetical protein
VVLQAQDVAFGFADAAVREVGDTAIVADFFEQGPGLLQPAGVSGEQPPPGLQLEDSRLFSYVALFGQLDPSLCGRQWQVRRQQRPAEAAAQGFYKWCRNVIRLTSDAPTYAIYKICRHTKHALL